MCVCLTAHSAPQTQGPLSVLSCTAWGTAWPCFCMQLRLPACICVCVCVCRASSQHFSIHSMFQTSMPCARLHVCALLCVSLCLLSSQHFSIHSMFQTKMAPTGRPSGGSSSKSMRTSPHSTSNDDAPTVKTIDDDQRSLVLQVKGPSHSLFLPMRSHTFEFPFFCTSIMRLHISPGLPIPACMMHTRVTTSCPDYCN